MALLMQSRARICSNGLFVGHQRDVNIILAYPAVHGTDFHVLEKGVRSCTAWCFWDLTCCLQHITQQALGLQSCPKAFLYQKQLGGAWSCVFGLSFLTRARRAYSSMKMFRVQQEDFKIAVGNAAICNDEAQNEMSSGGLQSILQHVDLQGINRVFTQLW